MSKLRISKTMSKVRITSVQLETVVDVVQNDLTKAYEIDPNSIRRVWGIGIGNMFYTFSSKNPYRIISSDPKHPKLINPAEKDDIVVGQTYGFHEETLLEQKQYRITR